MPRLCRLIGLVLVLLCLSNNAAMADPTSKDTGVYLGTSQMDVCMSCNVLGAMMSTVYDIGQNLYDTLRNSTTALIGMIFVLYIFFNAAKLLMPFGPLENARGTLNAMMTRTTVVMLCCLMLVNFDNFWDNIFGPGVTAAMNLTITVMNEADKVTGGALDQSTTKGCKFINDTGVADNGAFDVKYGVKCVTYKLQNVIIKGMTFAVVSMMARIDSLAKMVGNFGPINAVYECIANARPVEEQGEGNPVFEWFKEKFIGAVRTTGCFIGAIKDTIELIAAVPEILITFLGGFVIFITYLPAYLTLPLKVADVVIRWCIVSVLSPLLIAAAAFPASRSFMVNGLRGFAQACFELVLYGVVIALSAAAMKAVVSDQSPGGWTTLVVGQMFWQFWLIGVLTNIMIGKCKTFAIAFTDPAGQGMNADAVGEMADKAMDMAKGAAMMAFSSAAEGIGGLAQDTKNAATQQPSKPNSNQADPNANKPAKDGETSGDAVQEEAEKSKATQESGSGGGSGGGGKKP